MSKPKSTTKKAAKAVKTDEAKLAKLVESGEVKIAPAAEATPEKPTKAGKAKASSTSKAAKEKAPKEDLCVFALRLTTAERDAIHAAAGPAKASRFARALLVAAANGDEAELKNILKAVGAAK